MTPYKMAEVRGTSTNEVLDVVRRIISRAEGGRLITEDGKGGRRLVWTGYARANWDCSRVLALEAPAGLIYGALTASKKVEWVFRDQDGEEAWLVGTAELKVAAKVDSTASLLPLTLVTRVEWTGVEIRSHGISICVRVAPSLPSGSEGGSALSSSSKR
jgi:hypothetical protein